MSHGCDQGPGSPSQGHDFTYTIHALFAVSFGNYSFTQMYPQGYFRDIDVIMPLPCTNAYEKNEEYVYVNHMKPHTYIKLSSG